MGEGEDAINSELTKKMTMKAGKPGVGDQEEGKGGFGIGIAPKESKPANKVDMTRSLGPEGEVQEDDANENGEEAEDDVDFSREKKRRKNDKRPAIPRQEAFAEFKNEDGKQIEESIVGNRNDLRKKKVDVKDLTDTCNKAKREIDSIKVKLE
jgi:outer membrane translocation and assembly module TamA